jgi:hypothetical protein
MISLPRRHLASLEELATRVLESRSVGVENETLARDLLAGFFEVCVRAGLDGVLVALEQAFPPLAIADGLALAEETRLREELVGRLGNKAEFDPRGPRNAKPRQLAECLIASLSLELADPADRTITLTDELRAEVAAALTSVVATELAVPQVRETIIATGRGLCEEPYQKAYDRMSAELDERGMRLTRQLKLPLDAVQAVQRVLFEARTKVIENAARAAIDRAMPVLARGNPDAAARIDQPITHSLTPREVAIHRVCDARAPRAPEAVVLLLLESLGELAELVWSRPLQHARAYSPSTTFAVGELMDHPKFGRGTVKTTAIQRVEVEFAEGTHTLVHARGK